MPADGVPARHTRNRRSDGDGHGSRQPATAGRGLSGRSAPAPGRDGPAEPFRGRPARSEALHRSLFENNLAVMLLIDPDTGAIRDANPAACRYYWAGAGETLQQKNVDAINTLTRAELFAQMELARSEKRSNFFFQHRRADGGIRDVEVYSGPLTLQGKTLLYSIIHDITDRRQAEESSGKPSGNTGNSPIRFRKSSSKWMRMETSSI